MIVELTQKQISMILTKYFKEQDSDINFIYFRVANGIEFGGAMVDCDCEVELPENYDE